ncbi:MAG: hypothetical protein JKY65_25905, partial [Planctomycetes bacterium]|nr:hypothetical protein [Planctomycetota bacterium]
PAPGLSTPAPGLSTPAPSLSPRASLPSAPSPSPDLTFPDLAEFEKYLALGLQHQARSEFEGARDAIGEAIDIAPWSSRGYEARAELALVQGKLKSAEKDFEVAISRRPPPDESARLEIKLARVQGRLHQTERAHQTLQGILAEARVSEGVRGPAALELELLLLSAGDPIDARVDPDAAAVYQAALDLGTSKPPSASELVADGEDWPIPVDLVTRRVERYRTQLAFAFRNERDPHASILARRILADPALVRYLQGTPLLASARAIAGLAAVQTDAQDALIELEEAVRASPESLFARGALGRVHVQAGSRGRGLQLGREARAHATSGANPASRAYREGVRLSRLAIRGRSAALYRAARLTLIRAQHLYPLHADALLERSRLYAAFNAPRPALAAADAAIRLDPTYAEAHEWLGYLYLDGLPKRLQSLQLAERAFNFAIEVTLRGKVTGRRVGPAHAWFGRSQVRARQLRALLPSATVTPRRAELLADQLRDLIQACAAAPDRFPIASSRQVRRALRYQEALRDFYRAHGPIEKFNQLEARVRETTNAVEVAARQLLEKALAQGLRPEPGYSQAITLLDGAIELDPSLANAIQLRGESYLKIGNFVPALLDFSLAIERDPSLGPKLVTRITALSGFIDLNRVISILNQVVAANPKSHEYFVRGVFHLAKAKFKNWNQEDFQRGEADFSRCLELKPHVTAYLLRARIRELALQAWGRSSSAEVLGDLAAALKLNPNSGLARVALARELVRLGRVEEAFAKLYEARALGPIEPEQLHDEAFDDIRRDRRFSDLGPAKEKR